MTRRSLVLACVLFALTLPGCKRQHAPFVHEFDTQVAAAQHRRFNVDGPPRDQQLTVIVRSIGAPVSAFLVLSGDADALEGALEAGKDPNSTLALAHEVVRDNATL